MALCDKQQREVTRSAGESTLQAHACNGTRSIHPSPFDAAPNTAAEVGDDPGLTPLDPATSHQLLAALRRLPRPLLESCTKAFRKRFQVPEDATSIADRILQKRHQDWIEAYLVQHAPVPA